MLGYATMFLLSETRLLKYEWLFDNQIWLLVSSNTNMEDAMEKMYRDVVLTISADAEQKEAKSGYRITVRFMFGDELTDKDLVDLLFDSSSLRVKFANHHRPKGREHLAELSKQPYVEWIVRKSGTRQTPEMSPFAMLDKLLAAGAIDEETYNDAKRRINEGR